VGEARSLAARRAIGTVSRTRPGARRALQAKTKAHGYELLKRFNRRIGPFWHPNIGQVLRNPKHTWCHRTKPIS